MRFRRVYTNIGHNILLRKYNIGAEILINKAIIYFYVKHSIFVEMAVTAKDKLREDQPCCET